MREDGPYWIAPLIDLLKYFKRENDCFFPTKESNCFGCTFTNKNPSTHRPVLYMLLEKEKKWSITCTFCLKKKVKWLYYSRRKVIGRYLKKVAVTFLVTSDYQIEFFFLPTWKRFFYCSLVDKNHSTMNYENKDYYYYYDLSSQSTNVGRPSSCRKLRPRITW